VLVQSGYSDRDVSGLLDGLDIGLLVGTGLSFERFAVTGRYTHGVRNISIFDGAGVKNRSIAIMAAIKVE
jgi:hypothetical protein